MKYKVSDYIAQFFRVNEIPCVFEVAGGMITHLLDSVAKVGYTKIVSVHHEQSAAFAADAVGAAYQALSAAIAGLLEGPMPVGHSPLVAAIYRELVPTGRLPLAVHASLAKLHDLSTLSVHGIDVDSATARDAVTESAGWIERLTVEN